MKKMVILLIAFFVISFNFLSGCDEHNNSSLIDEKKLIVTWENTRVLEGGNEIIIVVYKSDKTWISTSTYNGSSVSSNGTWEIIDNKHRSKCFNNECYI